MSKLGLTTKPKMFDLIGQFTTVPNTVIEMWEQIGMDAFGLFVYLRYRSGNRDECWPSYTDIQKNTGLTRRRIAQAVRALEDAGLCHRRKRFGGSTVYIITCPSPTISNNDGLMDAPVVQGVDYSSSGGGLSVVQGVHTNKTHLTRLTEQDSQDAPDGAGASSPKSKRQPKKSAPTAAPADPPASLDTPDFRAAWNEWCTYRRERKNPLTPTSIKKQYAELEKYGPATAAAMLEQSILNGWAGLFPLKANGNGASPNREAAQAVAAGKVPRQAIKIAVGSERQNTLK